MLFSFKTIISYRSAVLLTQLLISNSLCFYCDWFTNGIYNGKNYLQAVFATRTLPVCENVFPESPNAGNHSSYTVYRLPIWQKWHMNDKMRLLLLVVKIHEQIKYDQPKQIFLGVCLCSKCISLFILIQYQVVIVSINYNNKPTRESVQNGGVYSAKSTNLCCVFLFSLTKSW